MEEKGIGFSITLTNLFFNDEDYWHSYELIKKHYKRINSVICVSDELAGQIKNDFPDLTVKASLIKNLNTIKKIEGALKIYDYAVVPMEMNDDDVFLEGIKEKHRVILFGNADCAYNCPSKVCYAAHSRIYSGKSRSDVECSKDSIPRPDLGYVVFDIKKLFNMGFNYFKLIPPRTLNVRFNRKKNG